MITQNHAVFENGHSLKGMEQVSVSKLIAGLYDSG